MKSIIHVLVIGYLLSLSSCSKKSFISSSSIKSDNFVSVYDNKKTHLVRLVNSNGLEVCITNYGARIVSLMVPDKNGKFEDIVCGFDNIASYSSQKQNFGSVVGRYIGRILGASFVLDETEYKLQAGGNGHCAHGGTPGFADKVWQITSKKKNRVRLSYLSADGENGFPGNLSITVTYTISDNDELIIYYEATTDKPTVLNPSNHSFFNIAGTLDKSINNQLLWIDGDSIAEYDSAKCVTGRMMAVRNTPFDFSTLHKIGDRIDDDNSQLKVTGGYDHTWKLKNKGDVNVMVSKIYDDNSGRTMEVYTTEPGLHIYTANGHKGNIEGKKGIMYPKRNSICFETMHFADSPNKPQFPSTVLRPNHKFESTTIFKFKYI